MYKMCERNAQNVFWGPEFLLIYGRGFGSFLADGMNVPFSKVNLLFTVIIG